MKTLYVSDLDGTLLNSLQKTSDYTNHIVNTLVENGTLFSFATARSYSTAQKVTDGICVDIPISVYNGTFIVNNLTGQKLVSNFFDSGIENIIIDLISDGIYPIVYSVIDGEEKFSYIWDKSNQGQKMFIKSRKGDIRENSVKCVSDLLKGEIFYISCIYDKKHLEPFYIKYRDKFNCLYQKDVYDNSQWLEIMPKKATKANAVMTLKKMLSCDRIVTFGDGLNDIEMFKIADECYAVSNAEENLKEIATGIIDSNNNDGVAKWLEENVGL